MKTIPEFLKRKAAGKPITMVTCYDAATAKILSESDVDALLVGDSCAMVVHGYPSTLHATLEMMAAHTSASRRGAPEKLIVADMPFLSFRKGLDAAMDAVAALTRAGADAVKLERAEGNQELIRRIVESGVPVMGHLGLTPQSVNAFGGFKLQAKDDASAKRLLKEAKELESAGCFSIVLECIPGHVAEEATRELAIPTIGIGCGPHASGQVLVINDLLGMDAGFQPRFARKYATLNETILESVNGFVRDTTTGSFPGSGEYRS